MFRLSSSSKMAPAYFDGVIPITAKLQGTGNREWIINEEGSKNLMGMEG